MIIMVSLISFPSSGVSLPYYVNVAENKQYQDHLPLTPKCFNLGKSLLPAILDAEITRFARM